ncbi:hypothetical protein [Streptomyces sp. SID3343]|uniref:hypothetical protein n=1 Tax=Streptomyces sp. SID3343 TaxID=2690260 RepID=UPI001928A029|nr:hypothetical protein [Streptomyces sp. SID3343]
MTADAVAALADGARPTVSAGDTCPVVTNAAAPRPFTLTRTAEPVSGHRAPERR